LGAPIAMGYVDILSAVDGTPVSVIVRQSPREALIAPMPFVPHRYKRSGS
jgi:aminomethyltransferase